MGITIIGTVISYAGPVSSTTQFDSEGWLLCDGSEIDRTKYAQLYDVIGILYGSGDSKTTFNLPNFQGMFLRGVSNNSNNDPDANDRTSQQNQFGGAGTSSGNAVGSVQEDQYMNHSHTVWAAVNDGHNIYKAGSDRAGAYNGNQPTDTSGGNETRPKNAYVNYLICFA